MKAIFGSLLLIAIAVALTGCGGGGTGSAVPLDVIVFVSDRGGQPDLWLITGTRGGSPVQLTDDAFAENDPTFSRDGSKIAFARMDAGNGFDIWQMNANGSSQTQITFVGTAIHPSYNLAGNKIVYQANPQNDTEIYEQTIGGGPPVQLTDNTAADEYPCYSPDGTKIAFSSGRDGNSEIYIMNSNGTNQTRLTFTASADEYTAAFSPDGTKIVFSSFSLAGNGIYIMNVDGSGVTPLLVESFDIGYPTFSTDGSRIVFETRRTGDDEIFSMTPIGGDLRNLTLDVAADYHPHVGRGR